MPPRILRSFGDSRRGASHVSTSQSVTGHLPSRSLSLASAPTGQPHRPLSHLREPKLPCFGHPKKLSSLFCGRDNPLPNSAPTLSVHPKAAVHGPISKPFVIGLVSFWLLPPKHEVLIRDQGSDGEGTPTWSALLLSTEILPLPSSFGTPRLLSLLRARTQKQLHFRRSCSLCFCIYKIDFSAFS